MALFDTRHLVALYAGADLFSTDARIRRMMRKKTARWLDESFFRIVTQTAPDNFLECGARRAGASTRFLREIGTRAVALEANPLTWEKKTRLAEQAGVTVLNNGVAEIDGERLEFFMPSDYPDAGNASFLSARGTPCESVSVATRSIDCLCDDYFPPDQQVALWIDVEGLSLPVLRGARDLLAKGRCSAMKIEIETAPLWEGQHLASEVDAYLDSLGYVPLLCDFEYESQFNAIYVRRSALDSLDLVVQGLLYELARQRPTLSQKLFKSRNYIWRRHRHRSNAA